MSKIIIIISCFFAVFSSLDATPTGRYLEAHPIEKIIEDGKTGKKVEKFREELLQIASHETDETFFAYHGMTQQNRIFQDILHVIFETTLEIPLPKNFYFIRLPSETTIREEKGAEAFLKGAHDFSLEFQEKTMHYFFEFLEKKTILKFLVEDFTKEEQEHIWDFLLSCSRENQRDWWMERVENYTLPVDYPIENSDHEIYREKLYHLISNKLCSQGRYSQVDQWTLFFQESPKFYLDLLDFLCESQENENKDFERALKSFLYSFDDTSSPQKQLLVSLNVPLLGNYNVRGCFTPSIYIKDYSVLGSEWRLKGLLEAYFEEIGLDTALVEDLWRIGNAIYPEFGKPQGCLLQLFDQSADEGKPPFSFINYHSFVSFKFGVPVPDLLPSELVQGNYPVSTNGRDLELRLITNMGGVLNPFSSLRMIRYDGLNKEDHALMMKHMKAVLEKSARDESKIERYKKFLEEHWNSKNKACLSYDAR